MALKGNLRDFSTTQLLNLINLARKTGTLTIDGPEPAKMAFREGKLVYASLGTNSSNLARMLHEAGKLSERQMSLIESKASGMSDSVFIVTAAGWRCGASRRSPRSSWR